MTLVKKLRIAQCQLNTRVGDIVGNVAQVTEALAQAERDGANIAVFPELAVTGYPPMDELRKDRFVHDNIRAVLDIASRTRDCVAVVGFVDVVRGTGDVELRKPDGSLRLRNAVAICHNGRVVGVHHKRHLPDYNVFDESRYFEPRVAPSELYSIRGVRVGVEICEDVWEDSPTLELGQGGAELIVVPNASPYAKGKINGRKTLIANRARQAGAPIVYVNQVGGQDELIFDGGSFVVDASGAPISTSVQFTEAITYADVEVPERNLDDPTEVPNKLEVIPVVDGATRSTGSALDVMNSVHAPLPLMEELYTALVIGTRDYVMKNGFTDVVLGVSGGVDSALVAAIAVDALGPDHVHGVRLPSRYSSDGSLDDAEQLGRNLGVSDMMTIPIEPAHQAFMSMFRDALGGEPQGLTEENLQSRIRGMTLMGLTNNNRGWLVLTTGNKSETATGYSTLYGDTAGGFAVIQNVLKTTVFELCRWRNTQAGFDIIPDSILTKPPSAELRPDQKDTDSLPDYDVLDALVVKLIEERKTVDQVVEEGADPAVAAKLSRLINANEYKRRQSPPGLVVDDLSFGRARRMPLTTGYSPYGSNAEDPGPIELER